MRTRLFTGLVMVALVAVIGLAMFEPADAAVSAANARQYKGLYPVQVVSACWDSFALDADSSVVFDCSGYDYFVVWAWADTCAGSSDSVAANVDVGFRLTDCKAIFSAGGASETEASSYVTVYDDCLGTAIDAVTDVECSTQYQATSHYSDVPGLPIYGDRMKVTFDNKQTGEIARLKGCVVVALYNLSK